MLEHLSFYLSSLWDRENRISFYKNFPILIPARLLLGKFVSTAKKTLPGSFSSFWPTALDTVIISPFSKWIFLLIVSRRVSRTLCNTFSHTCNLWNYDFIWSHYFVTSSATTYECELRVSYAKVVIYWITPWIQAEKL